MKKTTVRLEEPIHTLLEQIAAKRGLSLSVSRCKNNPVLISYGSLMPGGQPQGYHEALSGHGCGPGGGGAKPELIIAPVNS